MLTLKQHLPPKNKVNDINLTLNLLIFKQLYGQSVFSILFEHLESFCCRHILLTLFAFHLFFLSSLQFKPLQCCFIFESPLLHQPFVLFCLFRFLISYCLTVTTFIFNSSLEKVIHHSFTLGLCLLLLLHSLCVFLLLLIEQLKHTWFDNILIECVVL